uniref:Uncharacterized protein n=1 Tax=viral metagenome TaxID=1070528 RepID=A0A6C0CBK1_9ZZZZ
MSSTFIDNELIVALKEIIRRTNDMKKQTGGNDSVSSSISSAGNDTNKHSKSGSFSSAGNAKKHIKLNNSISSSISSAGGAKKHIQSASTISSDSHKKSKSFGGIKKGNEISSESSFFTEDTPKRTTKDKKKQPSTTLSDISSDSISSPSFGQQGGTINSEKEKKMWDELDRLLDN